MLNLINWILKRMGLVLVKAKKDQFLYRFWYSATNPRCNNRFTSSIFLLLPEPWHTYPLDQIYQAISLQTAYKEIGLMYHTQFIG